MRPRCTDADDRRNRPSSRFRSTEGLPASGSSSRARTIVRTLLAFLTLGLVWRVARYAACPPLWGDEAFIAVSLLTRDFAGLLRPLDYLQIAPVGFLGFELAVVRLLGPSENALRLLPFLSGIASLLLFERLARRLVDRRSALIAVGIFAASFYPVRHATELKPYSTDLLISLIATGMAWSTIRDIKNTGRWLGLTVLIAIGVWFSYPLVLVAAGLGMVLALTVASRPSRKVLVLFAIFGLMTSASWLASYFGAARPQARVTPLYAELKTWEGAFPPLSRPWLLPYWLIDVHTGNMLAYPNGGNHFASVGTAFLVAFGGLSLWHKRPLVLALLLSPLVPTFLASAIHRYPYGTSARISLYMAPAFCLLAGLGAVSLIRRLTGTGRRRAYRLAIATLGAMILVATVVNVALPYKNYEDKENRRAVVELASLSAPGDRWIGYDGLEELPLSKTLLLEHWLQQMAEVKYNLLARAPGKILWMPNEKSAIGPALGRTWLIVHRSGCPNFDEERLERLKANLTRQLGPPVVHDWPLLLGESIRAYEYPATASE
ncbi:glycosyltransferase family 39 protein [Tundrisphaera lichenicola]|uniref:glycosyltransferase family 39 protein n=1 Tax=Tundrisphaera lichenicola TaxID=2029860 RepID=UPI003EBE60DF